MRFLPEVLVVMAKYPVPGAVKTRLARQVGDERACALYHAFLCDVAARFAGGPWQLVWAVDPPGSDFGAIAGAGSCCIDQEGSGLAERMRRCFEVLFAGGAKRAVMIGGDVPHIPRSTIDAAFAALTDHDVALAPTSDGGYCLVGLRQAVDIFSPIAMSTPEVFDRTRALAASLGLRLRVLGESFDVDELDDVMVLERQLNAGGEELPHTATVLQEWRAAGVIPPNGRSRQ